MNSGPYTQISRLGNPLVNEVIIPMGKKDYWNTQPPAHDKQFAAYVAHPELAELLPVAVSGGLPQPGRAQQVGQGRARTSRRSC